MQIDLQFDQSVSNASSRRIASINEAANFLDNIITDPITVTMDIGDGEVESQILGQNVLDATIPGGFQVTYDQLVSALKANRGGRYLRPTICLTPLWLGREAEVSVWMGRAHNLISEAREAGLALGPAPSQAQLITAMRAVDQTSPLVCSIACRAPFITSIQLRGIKRVVQTAKIWKRRGA